MASPSDFLSYVLPYVTGCSMPLAQQQIVSICRDFCSRAPVVQELLDPIDAIAGQAMYDLDAPSGTDVSLVIEAFYLGNELLPMASGKPGLAQPNARGTPSRFRQAADNTLSLNVAPISSVQRAITLLVSTKPTLRATSLPDVLLNDYAYQIGMGVVGRLMLMPDKDFSNPSSAGFYTRIYDTACADARIRAEAGFGKGAARVNPRRFE